MSNKTKTGRKNRTNLVVQWPTKPFWTVEQLWQLEGKNTGFILITLRVRLQQLVDRGEVAVIGELKGDKGRPKKVYACEPVAQETLEAARAEGITVDYHPKITMTPPKFQPIASAALTNSKEPAVSA